MENAPTDYMHAYIWAEGTADQSADNILFILHDDLKDRLVIGTKYKIGHLVYGCNNCPGQNKNSCVLKYCAWLVKSGYATKVLLIFLIKGHTKKCMQWEI